MRIIWDDGNTYPASRNPLGDSPISLVAEFQIASGMKMADIDSIEQQDALALPLIFWFALHKHGITVNWKKLCEHSLEWYQERLRADEQDLPADDTETETVPKEPISAAPKGRHATLASSG
jgi:hypothetical protein